MKNDSGMITENPSLTSAMFRSLSRMSGAEIEDVVNTRLLARRERERALIEIFGAPVYMSTTILPRVGQEPLGPAFYMGHELVWGLWAPHRQALVDIFKRRLPDEEELAARATFAQEHELKYAIVRPGWRVTPDHLKGWLGL